MSDFDGDISSLSKFDPIYNNAPHYYPDIDNIDDQKRVIEGDHINDINGSFNLQDISQKSPYPKKQRLDSLFRHKELRKPPAYSKQDTSLDSFHSDGGTPMTDKVERWSKEKQARRDPQSRDSEVIILTSEEEESAKESSDDEIQILEAKEVPEAGNFKNDSFSQRIENTMNVDSKNDDDSFDSIASNSSVLPEVSNFSTEARDTTHSENDNLVKIFNQPVPVPHFTAADRTTMDELGLERTRRRLDVVMQEKRDLLRKHEEAANEYTKYLRLISETENYISDLKTRIMNEYLRENQDVEATILVKEKITDIQHLNHIYHRKKEECVETLKLISNRLSSLTVRIRQIRSEIGKIGLGVKEVYQDNRRTGIASEVVDIGSDYHDLNSYYLSSGNDEQQIQNLLNNIRSDDTDAKELVDTPGNMAVRLLKHQQIGLSWLVRMEESNSRGSILADSMGLGKTIQAIALIVSRASSDESHKTTLIVTPVSLLRQWSSEIDSKIKPSANLKIGIYHGVEKRNLSTYGQMKKYDVILTSYGTLSSEWKKHYKETLEYSTGKNQNAIPDYERGGVNYVSPFFSSEAVFYRIFLDEAQNIKNKVSVASKALYSLRGCYRHCLSGTPIQNNVDELYPILRFLRIQPYNNEYKFRSEILLPLRKSTAYGDYAREKSMQKLRALFRAILLRRSKDSMIDGKPILSLPPKHVLDDIITMQNKEYTYYKEVEKGIQSKAKTLLTSNQMGTTSGILTLLLRLRQACCHGFLADLGQIKSLVDKNLSRRKNNWRVMYKLVLSFSEDVVRRLRQEIEQGNDRNKEKSDTLFTCPMCYDVFSFDSVIIFPGCGHMICIDCIDIFFQKYEIFTEDTSKLASCYFCSRPVRKDHVIDFDVFYKIQYQKLSQQAIEEQYSHLEDEKLVDNKQKLQLLIKQNDNNLPTSAKIEKCLDLIKRIFQTRPDEKVIVFSQFVSLFDILDLFLQRHGIPYLRYDGSMSVENKNAAIRQFYRGEEKILLLSLRAGNVGLTLTCASQVIIMDPFWNPYVEEQAMDRTHRIGQHKEVYVHRLLIEDTVERRIIALQNEKKEIVSGALDEKGLKSVSQLGRQELGFLFGLNKLS